MKTICCTVVVILRSVIVIDKILIDSTPLVSEQGGYGSVFVTRNNNSANVLKGHLNSAQRNALGICIKAKPPRPERAG